jgi:hypothetical protein
VSLLIGQILNKLQDKVEELESRLSEAESYIDSIMMKTDPRYRERKVLEEAGDWMAERLKKKAARKNGRH